MMEADFLVPESLVGERLDRVVTALSPALTRSQAQRLIESGDVRVNGQTARSSERCHSGVVVTVRRPIPSPMTITPEAMPLDVRYQDDDVIVVDKPAGLVVHPAPGHESGTLVNAIIAYDPTIAIANELRPGIVHRLDKDTSGLLLVARNDRAMRELQRQLKDREVVKEYTALVGGQPPTRGIVDAPIGRDPRDRLSMAITTGGREARTHFEVVETLRQFSLVRVRLETGRTHQIRVHFASIDCPIVGDPRYGRGQTFPGLNRQFLHASRLVFKRPRDGQEIEVISELPVDLATVLATLRHQSNSDT